MRISDVLYYTKSVCPVCLRQISAAAVCEADGVYMRKTCPEHGEFRTVIWQDSAEEYEKWLSCGGVGFNDYPGTAEQLDGFLQGFSFTEEAAVQPSSAAFMTTKGCNINCPICFTRTAENSAADPDLEEIRSLLAEYRRKAGDDALLELCGGEPTTRKDLAGIIEAARTLGFDYIQLNTNGIRLAESADYCRKLKTAGLTTVYLGFDGISEQPYLTKYGRKMLDIKKQAVENCEAAGLAVVLVVCVIPGENDGELGEIIAYAKSRIPCVKGVYLQPVSYFGTYNDNDVRRITIPEVLRKLEMQTDGEIRKEDFSPGNYEHPQCTFNGNYILDSNGRLFAVTGRRERKHDDEAYKSIRKAVRSTWIPSDSPTLTISGMAFQDAYNIDLLRVSRCSVQIICRDGRMLPLCSKYLTDSEHRKINNGIS